MTFFQHCHACVAKTTWHAYPQARHSFVPVVFLRCSTHEKEIINLSDDDDDADGCKYQGLHREKATSQTIGENEDAQRVETIKRKHASDIEISTPTSTSYDDLFEMDTSKRSKTSLPG
ncbi:hypothetical protein VNO80_05297 [Phaseolus coccineus]|uniref:Uncharacterized protein n=1 Tax=Phaseolus coccineus TaxID=3886 RepID=A0AAN9RDJ8_PHACN